MGKVANRIGTIRERMGPHIQIGLARTANKAEVEARAIAEEFWLDDTGSARASITGWNPDLQSFDKNFDDSDWRDARSGLIKSKYPWNAPENYEPQVEVADRENDYEAYLSMFVRYAPDITPTMEGGEQLAIEVFKDVIAIMQPRALITLHGILARAII